MSSDSAQHEHHAIDYIEITATDVAEAKRFYGAAFGWAFSDYGPDYSGIQGKGREVGGICKGSRGAPGGPLVILYSRKLEDTVANVEAAGGRIVKAIFSFPGGRRFHFRDPSGNELAVWSDT
jgi:predicted enzyme related to lactoylglutathione lyase